MKLKLSKDLSLPLDAATESFAILGRRGSGKTHTAVVMAEEMLSAGVQVVVIDPLDVWWGLRVSKDGKTAGFPIYVAGGSHADIPLSADAGKVLADAVVDQGLSIVLSTRHLSKTDQRRFVGDFCERLYDRKADPKHRTALHVDIDEADAFVPQRLMPGAERCFGAVDTMIRRGRSSGLAVTLISQRPQVISKDVLSQTEVLVSHQLTGPQDRKALQAWIEANDDENRSAEFMGALASLPKGRAWFWSPGLLKIFKPVDVRDRTTFDSSATPKPGVVGVKPKAFAEVDLHKLTAEIAATIEKAKADDPRELRKQIADLKKELSKAGQIVPASTNSPAKIREVLTDADRALLDRIGAKIAEARRLLTVNSAHDFGDFLSTFDTRVAVLRKDILNEQADARDVFVALLESKGFQKIFGKLSAVSPQPSPAAVADFGRRFEAAARREPSPSRPARQVSEGESRERARPVGDGGLKTMERAMLTALAQHPEGLTKKQILIHASYSANGNTAAVFADFVREGWAEAHAAKALRITKAGIAALGDYEPLPLGDALRDQLLNGGKLNTMERSLLAAICAPYPEDISKSDALIAASYSANGNTAATFAKLVACGYVRPSAPKRLRAAEELFS